MILQGLLRPSWLYRQKSWHHTAGHLWNTSRPLPSVMLGPVGMISSREPADWLETCNRVAPGPQLWETWPCWTHQTSESSWARLFVPASSMLDFYWKETLTSKASLEGFPSEEVKMNPLGSEKFLVSREQRASLLSLCGPSLWKALVEPCCPTGYERPGHVLRQLGFCHLVKIKTKSHLIMTPLVLCS